MNCLLTPEIRAQNLQNKKLDRQLQIYKRNYNKQIKLLLLGNAGSGKSTFLRQMRIICDKPYTEAEKEEFIAIIHQNIFASMQTMIRAMDRLDIPYETKENDVINSNLIKYVDIKKPIFLNEVFLTALKELWADAGIQECYMRRNEYKLLDSTKYYLTHIDRFMEPCELLTDEDILRVHMPPTGLIEYMFKYKNVDFRITDVGDQRGSVRRKWMHGFDNITSIIFLADISEYDQFSVNSDNRNRLKESLEIFKSISSYRCFDEISIILVLNKLDILEEKIMYSHLSDYFPSYRGPNYDPHAAQQFIWSLFRQALPKTKLYHHFTNSVDAENTSIVFVYTAVRDTILNMNLYNFNLI